MISYKPFQKLLIDKGLKKQEVIKTAGISNATMAKMNTNEYVSLEVIDKLCVALNCQPGDLLEHIPVEKKTATPQTFNITLRNNPD
ncbi:MAG: XRE family transcriptional regulator [Peptococcaceae bacterium BRH_c4b]|nr:MAG: XRE family transcriptional regulator [Peptococcaceae bacterium BRH_c4b]